MGGHGAKVYIVDADCAVRDSFAALLDSVGIASRLFASPQALLEAFDASDAGCVTADLGDTGDPGLRLAGSLRGLGHAVPVILFCTRCDAETKRRVEDAGAVPLCKPTDPARFLQLVRQLIS